ncbi:hypothetical protein [Edaphobacter bradus]|uniref:hypothetical protein n=1 Tax=Edaphobacter bradus TaxID=2259016 RepID=UPI0021DFC273|nr:hypothetical protein [Edaphobacter bradus]
MLVLIQFDVCEEILLDKLRQIISASIVAQPALKHPTPSYIRFQRPPVIEPIEPLVLETGQTLQGEIKYYDYGVISVVFQLPFYGDWEMLIRLASHWVWDVDFAGNAGRIVRQKLEHARPALIKEYPEFLSEDYFIFHLREVTGRPSAGELVQIHGSRIAQVVRGDTMPLSDGECQEVLQSRISYYPDDLAVIGWNAAIVYDTTTGAETAIQLLEYANSQLLEFRHYDDLLSKQLDSAYDSLEGGTGILARWRMARSATRLYTVLLEVVELTERADNAIKFLSDMFAARLYKLAASKVGVPDYKDLVKQKIDTAENLYRFMVDQFNQSRAFFLESTVVIILVIELIYLFLGKPF